MGPQPQQMDEEKVIELVNIYLIKWGTTCILLTGHTSPSLFHRACSGWQEFSNTQSHTRDSSPGARFFKVVLTMFCASWQPALSSPIRVSQLSSMQPSTNYLSQRIEHLFWALPSSRFLQLLLQFKPFLLFPQGPCYSVTRVIPSVQRWPWLSLARNSSWVPTIN